MRPGQARGLGDGVGDWAHRPQAHPPPLGSLAPWQRLSPGTRIAAAPSQQPSPPQGHSLLLAHSSAHAPPSFPVAHSRPSSGRGELCPFPALPGPSEGERNCVPCLCPHGPTCTFQLNSSLDHAQQEHWRVQAHSRPWVGTGAASPLCREGGRGRPRWTGPSAPKVGGRPGDGSIQHMCVSFGPHNVLTILSLLPMLKLPVALPETLAAFPKTALQGPAPSKGPTAHPQPCLPPSRP